MKVDIIDAIPIKELMSATAWYEGANWLALYVNGIQLGIGIESDRKIHCFVESPKLIGVKNGKLHIHFRSHSNEEMGTEIDPVNDPIQDYLIDFKDLTRDHLELKDDEYPDPEYNHN